MLPMSDVPIGDEDRAESVAEDAWVAEHVDRQFSGVPLPVGYERWTVDQQHGWRLGVNATLATFDRDTLRAIGALEAERMRRRQLQADLETLRAEHSATIARCNAALQQVTGGRHG